MQSTEIKQALWRLLEQTFYKTQTSACVSTSTVEQWGSLNHINLMFAIESRFNVNLSAEDIALLFKDSDTEVSPENNQIEQ